MKKNTTHNLTVAAMLSAVAFILMFIEFPIPMLIPSFVKMVTIAGIIRTSVSIPAVICVSKVI